MTLLWLPLANSISIALAYYIDYDSNDLIKSVDKLDNYKYNHKSI